MVINFASSEETSTMYTRSDNIKIMMGSKTNDIIEKLYKSLLQRYQERLEEWMRERKFVCDSVICCIMILLQNKAQIQIK